MKRSMQAAAVCAINLTLLVSACASTDSTTPIGPAGPVLTVAPSAPWPARSLIPNTPLIVTDAVHDSTQLVLALSGQPGQVPQLADAWYDAKTRMYLNESESRFMTPVWFRQQPGLGLFSVGEAAIDGGGVVDVGIVRGGASRLVVTLEGHAYEAHLVPWSADNSISAFWVRRQGEVVDANTVDSKRPTVIVYGDNGAELDRQELNFKEHPRND